jgi:hypothetical protein
MDSLSFSFSQIPARLIIYYLVDDESSSSLSKIEYRISVCQRGIFDSQDENERESLRKKIKSFEGMRTLIMDQLCINF